MTDAPRTILFLHPSAELYGADRTLLQLVEGLDRTRWRAVVALPRPGPLAAALGRAGAVVEIGELGIGARASLSPRGLLGLAWRVPRGAWHVWRLVRRHRPAVVHTNTIIVLGGAIGARLSGARHLWHVHEILGRPRWLARLLARAVSLLAHRAVSNSEATRESMNREHPALAARHGKVLNGVATHSPARREERDATRGELGVAPPAPLVLLVGRINSWKGHGLMVEAARLLADRHPSAHYVFAGDAPPGQPWFEEELDTAIRAAGLEERVQHVPFRENITSLYDAADLCVVPSTRPEPFGLVAAEAMERGRPVIAANHGGVAEVVVDGETGLLFPPGDAAALADALDRLLRDPLRARRMGETGRIRQREHFTEERYVAEMEAQYDALARPAAAAPAPLPADTRLVHVCLGKANPDRLNGVNRVVHHLAAAQMRAGRSVEVWGLTATPAAPAGPRPYPLRLFHHGRMRMVLDRVLKAAIANLEAPVLVHLHGGLLPELALVARRLRRRRIPYVFTPHGTYRPEALAKRSFAKRVVIALFDRALLAGARGVQAFTECDAAAIGRYADPAKIEVAPNGQDPLPLSPTPNIGREHGRPLFGFCGRLDAHTKGLDLVLAGFAAHRRAGGEGELWLIGDGPDRAELQAEAKRLGVADRVVFHGARFGAEKFALLAQLDAFVHPSRHEGLPGAVLEAGMVPLPLLVSEGTNLGEEVRAFDAGLVLDEESAAAVQGGFALFETKYGTGELADHAANAERMVTTRFSWAHVEERIARDLYRMETEASLGSDRVLRPRPAYVRA